MPLIVPLIVPLRVPPIIPPIGIGGKGLGTGVTEADTVCLTVEAIENQVI